MPIVKPFVVPHDVSNIPVEVSFSCSESMPVLIAIATTHLWQKLPGYKMVRIADRSRVPLIMKILRAQEI